MCEAMRRLMQDEIADEVRELNKESKKSEIEELITPVGSTTKTENGTYDVKEYAEVVVNVPSGGNTLKNLLDATKSGYYLFYDYKGTSVDDLIQPSDTENVTAMNAMFSNCSNLTTIPLLNTSNVTTMHNMFFNCGKLTTVPALNVSNVVGTNNMFYNCTNLKSILMTNIGTNLDISASTKFERSDLVTILNNLKTVVSSKTLAMGATNLAKLTNEDKAIATNKG